MGPRVKPGDDEGEWPRVLTSFGGGREVESSGYRSSGQAKAQQGRRGYSLPFARRSGGAGSQP